MRTKPRESGPLRKDEQKICYCGNVSREQIVRAIRGGAKSLEQIQKATGAGVGKRCKELNPKGICCIPDIVEVLRAETGTQSGDGCSCSRCNPEED
jgi:NAD(P)H-nitrite reductase large subunit